MRDPHGGVARREHERAEEPARPVLEGLRDGQGDDEERPHRHDHREPEQALVGLCLVAQPGIGRPAEPQEGEQHQPPAEPASRRVVGHQGRHLGQGEDEDQVEEELEGGDPVRLVRRPDHEAGSAQHVRQRVTAPQCPSPAVR